MSYDIMGGDPYSSSSSYKEPKGCGAFLGDVLILIIGVPLVLIFTIIPASLVIGGILYLVYMLGLEVVKKYSLDEMLERLLSDLQGGDRDLLILVAAIIGGAVLVISVSVIIYKATRCPSPGCSRRRGH